MIFKPQHGSKEQPLTISQIADRINRQYAPFSDREQVINRSTVARTLESLVLYKEVGDLLDFFVIEGGSANKKNTTSKIIKLDKFWQEQVRIIYCPAAHTRFCTKEVQNRNR